MCLETVARVSQETWTLRQIDVKREFLRKARDFLRAHYFEFEALIYGNYSLL